MCLIEHIGELADAGISSLKIEGRMKSPYYVATVVNAYRRAIDDYYAGNPFNTDLVEELDRTSHRRYTTGFYFGSKDKEYLESSMPVQSYEFMAMVRGENKDGYVEIEQRNRFKVGDTLNVLSPGDEFNKDFLVEEMYDLDGGRVDDASLVQQRLRIKTQLKLKPGDILRKKIENKNESE